DHAGREPVQRLDHLVAASLGERDLPAEQESPREMRNEPPYEIALLGRERGRASRANQAQNGEGVILLQRHGAQEMEVPLGTEEIVVELGSDELSVGKQLAADEDLTGGQRPDLLPP